MDQPPVWTIPAEEEEEEANTPAGHPDHSIKYIYIHTRMYIYYFTLFLFFIILITKSPKIIKSNCNELKKNITFLASCIDIFIFLGI